jgi:hypothetical protein
LPPPDKIIFHSSVQDDALERVQTVTPKLQYRLHNQCEGGPSANTQNQFARIYVEKFGEMARQNSHREYDDLANVNDPSVGLFRESAQLHVPPALQKEFVDY